MRKIIAVIFVFSILMVGCRTKTVDDVSQTEENKPQSKDIEASSLWSDEELGKLGESIYPGFALDGVNLDGVDYRRMSSQDEVTILEELKYISDIPTSTEKITVNNNGKSMELTIPGGIGKLYNKHAQSDDDKNVFLEDLTGDGKSELIFAAAYGDLNSMWHYVEVCDLENMSQISIEDSDSIDKVIENAITDVKLLSITNNVLTVELNINGEKYKCEIDNVTADSVDDIEYSFLSDNLGGYEITDKQISYRKTLAFYKKGENSLLTGGQLNFRIDLNYNADNKIFTSDASSLTVDGQL